MLRAAVLLRWAVLALILVIVFVPMYWILVTSFKTGRQILLSENVYAPRPFTIDNYLYLFEESRFALWFRNSAITATASTLLSLLIGTAGAYALTRLRFPGRRSLGAIVLVTYLVPPGLMFIPLYQTFIRIGYTDSLGTLILAYPTFLVPFVTWLLMGFFRSIPRQLEEAAMVDGATRVQALFHVVLPLAAPGLLAAGLFCFTLSWNEFLYALIFIQDETLITVPVGLNLLIYGDVFHWGQLMAASVITTVPVVALYMFIHRWMVEGLAAGSVKG